MDFSFDPDHAAKYGLEEAVVIRLMTFWIHKNRTDGRNFHDDRTWTYNTVTGWLEHFPFWTKDQMRRVLERLKDKGVLICGNYNKTPMDRTVWYAFSDESIFLPSQIDLAKKPNGVGEGAKAIPVTNHYLNQEENQEPPKSPKGESTADQALAYLNEKTGRNFRTYKGTGLSTIIKLKYTLDDIRAVVDDRVKAWASDPKMAEYLRPATLFRVSNFEGYVNNLKGAPKKPDITPHDNTLPADDFVLKMIRGVR